MGSEVTYFGALFAGLLSFLSPCVLPLVPPYLCFLTGNTLDQLAAGNETTAVVEGRTFLSAVMFVLGFSTVFVALGAAASWIGQLVLDYQRPLSIVAGIVIILMGLHFLGVFRLAFMHREARYYHAARPAGTFGAFAIGLAFGFGWTPCIGPVLGTILAVAASEEQVGAGALLLAVYSLGIGIPFLIAALAVGPFLAFLQKFRKHVGRVEKAMGGLLVVTGVLFLTGTFTNMAYWLLETFPRLAEFG
jgi:cytochrome c-type biogenesis protein